MNKINSWNEIQVQIYHWLKCPEHAYLGSGYGYRDSIDNILKKTPDDAAVQEIILKMCKDIPILKGKNIDLTWVANRKQITIVVDSDTAIFTLPKNNGNGA